MESPHPNALGLPILYYVQYLKLIRIGPNMLASNVFDPGRRNMLIALDL